MSKSGHPLRAVRAASPHPTQAAFAAFLGVPVSTVQAVESGKARMTPRMAFLVREKTGADEVELLREKNGRALDLSGQRYTVRSFTAWQDSPQQAAETRSRKRSEAAHSGAWRQYLQEAAGLGNGGPPSNKEIIAAEDHIAPWQNCEFASAPSRAWKSLPESLRHLTGWSPGLDLPGGARLTLSVQAAPSWDPDGPPPGFSAANADLFPPCYFTVAAGSGGCRAAAAYWRAVCKEHAIDPVSGNPARENPTGSWRGFFSVRNGICEPHAVFAGIDPEETAALHGGLFSEGGILCGAAGDALADRTLEVIGEHSADAGSPAGILLFASLEGGTASALSSLLLTRIRIRYPSVPVMVVGVLPLTGISQVITAPWHLALAMQAIRRHASLAVLFSNDLLFAQGAKTWQFPRPGYAEANLLIAECLSALTAPLRFGGKDTQPVDLAAIIGCFSAEKEEDPALITAQCWPAATLRDGRLKALTLPRLARNTLAAARRPPLAVSTDSGAGIFLRIRTLPGPPWTTDNSPHSLKLTSRIAPGLHESATLFAASPVIRRTLRRIARQAREVWGIENAGALCSELGVTPGDMEAAIHALAGPR